MNELSKKIQDKRLLRLVHSILRANIQEQGNQISCKQGGPLSPLLSNIILDKLDKELERRGHRFVCYADDCSIYVKSKRAGERVMESISTYIEKFGRAVADSSIIFVAMLVSQIRSVVLH